MNRLSICIVLTIILTVPVAVIAQGGERTTIRNNLLPGHFTEHRIQRVIHRKTKKDKKSEELVYSHLTDWVQLNVHEPRPGGVRVFQMVVDHPAKVVSLFKGAQRVTPTPSPDYFGLSRGNTRLHSLERSPTEAPALIPKCARAEAAVLRAMIDVAYWQRGQVETGGKWVRDVRESDFEGTQQFEFTELLRAKDETAAVLTMYVTGAFKGDLENEYEFIKGQAIIHWARMDRSLLKLEARAEYVRKRPGGNEEYVMELNVGLKKMKTYNAEELEVFVDQLIAFDEADRAVRSGDKAVARQHVAEFRRKWPTAVWMPALDELERRISPSERAVRPMKTSEMNRVLGEALIKWEAAKAKRDYDLLDQTRRLIKALIKDHAAKIRTLAKKGDDQQRGPAVFALAFSADEDDFYSVQKYARDNSAAVRAMALAGLAARADAKTSVELLIITLDDEKANVRARACEAVAACVSREHYSVDKIAARLGELLIDDETAGVRYEAVQALAAVGGQSDIPKLEKALSRELDKEIRREIQRAIRKLEKRGG